MKKVEVYLGNKKNVKVSVFDNSIKEDALYTLSGDEAMAYIKLYEKKALEKVDIGYNDATLFFDSNVFHLNECEKLFENTDIYSLFVPMIENIKKTKEKEASNKTNSKRVIRENKYNKAKIIATSVVAALVLVAGVVTMVYFNKPKTDEDDIGTLDEEVIVETENPDALEKNFDSKLQKPSSLQIPQKTVQSYPEISILYNERTDEEKVKLEGVVKNYGDVINKYAKKYGLDPNLITAIATQESGVHRSTMDSGGATGLMQIQNSAWNDESLTAYNFDTNSYENIRVDTSNLGDLDYNVKIACMIYQTCLRNMKYNLMASLQAYNMGIGAMNTILNNYCIDCNKTKDEVLMENSDTDWMNYRSLIKFGDRKYIENVISYLGSNFRITNINPDGEEVTVGVSRTEFSKTIS